MTEIALLNQLAFEFGVSVQVVYSWFKRWFFSDLNSGKKFFEKNLDTIKAKPFVKWVWWKRQLIAQFQELYPSDFNDYFEPFLWGGAVFFDLQREKSFLSDINEELINTYKVVKNKPKKLIVFLESINHSKETFLEMRSWDRDGGLKNYSDIERAGRFIYLNRVCFNGIYRVNSKWEFNVPFGKYSNPDFIQEENILNTSKLLKETKAEIKVQSFEKVLNKAKKWDLVYFDPPYDTLSESANFTSYSEWGFWRAMQERLRDVFVELSKKWVYVMLSNHNTPFIRELYKWFRFEVVKARRSVNSKWSGRGEIEEVVVLNY